MGGCCIFYSSVKGGGENMLDKPRVIIVYLARSKARKLTVAEDPNQSKLEVD